MPAAVASGLTRIAGATAAAAVGAAVLLSLAPSLLPVATFTVLSGSMQPAIPVGAVVIATPVPASDLRLGDVITFQAPGRSALVTHRIDRIAQAPSGPVFETKGDANAAPDPWELTPRGTVYRYVFHVPFLGYAIVASQSAGVRAAIAGLAALAFAILWWRSPEPRPQAAAG